MFIPVSTDIEWRKTPFANWAILFLCVVVFLFTLRADADEVKPFILTGASPLGLLGSMWLHADILHLGGNMLFLWVFGNAVCSRIGNGWYLLAYLGLGLASDLAFLVFDGRPSIGASGAISGIMGMFMVLFPASRIRLVYGWFYVVLGQVRVPAFWVMLLWFLFDLYGALALHGRVAWWAHVGGTVSGAALAAVALHMEWVEMFKGERSLLDYLEWTPAARIEERERPPAPTWRAAEAPRAPAPPPDGSRFQPWRPTARGTRIRCGCGRNLVFMPDEAGRLTRCPACSKWVRLPTDVRPAGPHPAATA